MATQTTQQPDGFGFQPGELIPTAPYIFGGEQDLCYVLEFAAAYGDYIPIIGWIIALVAEIVLDILQLIDELVALFTGKPRAQDTLTVAGRLARGANPAATLMAVQIHRNLAQNGIVLSSSTRADQKILGAIRRQGEAMLVRQGATQARAAQVVDQVWSHTTSNTQPLPVELNQPLASGLTLVGTTAQQAIYVDAYNIAIQSGDDPEQAARKATNALLNHSKMGDLGRMSVQPLPQPINPPPPQPPPPPPPPGQPPPPGTPPPGTPPAPCYPSAQDNQGDELTDGLNCVAQNLSVLAYYMPQLTQALAGQADPVTCTQITTQVALITAQLADIAIALTGPSGAPPGTIDLTTVVIAIGNLVAAVAAIPGASEAGAQLIATAIAPIASAIADYPPPNLDAIVTALRNLFSTIDVPPQIVEQLVASGYLNDDAVATIGQGAFGSVLVTVIVNFAYKALSNFLTAWGISYKGGRISVANPRDTIAADVGGLLSTLLSSSDTALTPIVQRLVTQIRALLVPAGETSIGVIGVNPDSPVSAAVGGAFAAAGAAWLLAFTGIDEGGPLAHIAELVAGAIGFDELRDVLIGPLVRNGIALVADRQAKALFQQELPGTSTLQTWVAMGLYNPTRAQALSLLNGTSDELYPISQLAQYRGLNARQMLRLIETDLFSTADIADELTFSAMRPISQKRMLSAAPYLATASERSSLRATLESAFVAGLLTAAELTTQVDDAESNIDRDSLCLSRVNLQVMIAEAKDFETEYTTLYKAGLMTDELYRANLTAIGLQPWKVNTVAAKAEASANATLQRRTLAAEAALEKATEAKARTAAMNSFVAGHLDAAGLAAALVATGLTLAQTAAWLDLAVLRKAGGLRWIYGLQLPAQQATLLRQRVGALTDQRKRLQITDDQYVVQLKALGIGAKYVNALQAAADAMITPKTSAFAVPVHTN